MWGKRSAQRPLKPFAFGALRWAEGGLNALAEVVTPVQSHYLWRPQLRDPNDEMVLEAAVNGHADYLVTLNVRDFTLATSRWQFNLLSPGLFLRLLENTS